jgi:hypothetical protein
MNDECNLVLCVCVCVCARARMCLRVQTDEMKGEVYRQVTQHYSEPSINFTFVQK